MRGAAAWPVAPDPRDPFVGVLDDLPAPRRPLADALRGAVAGTERPERVERLAAEAGLDAPLRPEPPPGPPAAGPIPSDADLVRLGTDLDPALVPAALDLVLGRDAEDWPRPARIAAVAWGAMLPTPDGPSLLEQWIRRYAPRAAGPGGRAVARTPPALWRAAGEEVAGWLGPAAAPAGSPATTVFARRVPVNGGWHLAAAIPVAAVPPPGRLQALLRWAALAERARGLEIRTVGDALRAAGHHVARWLAESGGPP